MNLMEKKEEPQKEKLTPIYYVSIGLTFGLTILFLLGFIFPFFSASYASYIVDENGNSSLHSYTEDRTLITVFQDGDFEIFGVVYLMLLLLSITLSVFALFSLVKKRRYLPVTYAISAALFTLSGFLLLDSSILMKVILGVLAGYYVVYNIDTLYQERDRKAGFYIIFLTLSIVLFVLFAMFGVAFTPTR